MPPPVAGPPRGNQASGARQDAPPDGPDHGREDGTTEAKPRYDAEILERLRRSGFRIDREGEFQHEGESVRHEGLRRALFRWLDSLPDGRTILRLDAHRFAYVDVDDTPLVARAARIVRGTILLALSDGGEEALDPSSLVVDAAGVMRCRVHGGRLAARLSTAAAAVVADLIEDGADGPALVVSTGIFPLGNRS